MQLLKWLVAQPSRVAAAIVIGTAAACRADQIGSHQAQIEAFRADGGFCGGDYYGAPAGAGPHRGLGVARRIAQLSYRSPAELDLRFGSSAQIGEDPYGWPSTTMPTNRPGASTPTATSCSAMPWACLIWDGAEAGLSKP